jgi:hypothetical protein
MKTEEQIKEKINEYNKVLAIYNGIITDQGKKYLMRDIELLRWVLCDIDKLERIG